MTIKVESLSIAEKILADYDTFLFDCDGVLWLGKHLLAKVPETLALLRSKGKSVYFVTNNSTKSRAAYSKKFRSFGIDVDVDEIFTSSYAASLYVNTVLKLKPGIDKIWVLGEEGIVEELGLMGYETVGGMDPRLDMPFAVETSPFVGEHLDLDVKCVVAGLDTNLNYHRISATLQYLRRSDVHFVATNLDNTLPQKGLFLPGAGTIVQSLVTASNREPVACGKPNQNMLDCIVERYQLNRERTIMVGDRLNTDVKFGLDGGLGTLLVLTGIETEPNVLNPKDGFRPPKYYAESLGMLYELLTA